MGAQTDPLIGRLVDGRYRVRARIARGGMATVYVATDLRLERRVALKVMHGHLSDDSIFQSRFIQEARAAARLADPHVVNVFDQGQDGDMAYLVMEYLPGITLRELIREQRGLTVPQTITIMDAILSGLAAAHRAGIVHRDVKPENVLLAEDGRIKIGDFGLARATTANTATGQMLLGTIAYLAPELVTRGTADARSDIYALGIMLYEMLTGEQPYKGEQPMQIAYQHANDSVPRPSAKKSDVPEQLDELVLWSTEREPDERPVDAATMLERLREIERELGIAPQVARTLAASTTTREPGLDSDELTRTLPPAVTGPHPTVEAVDNATALRRSSRRRAAKGGWLFALLVLLTAGAAAAGWWFGSGPGSMVAVADVAQLTYEKAEARLAQDTLVAERADEYSADIPAGTVIRTEPDAGTRVDQDTTVTVVVSQGPQPHEIDALAGMSADQARQRLEAAGVSVGEDSVQFDGADSGTVLAASVTPVAGGDAIDCANGCTVYAGDSAALTVSAGAVPEVSGMSVDEATSTLTGVGLQVSGEQITEYSDSVAEGVVIRSVLPDGTIRPGDTVTLVVSLGPQPIEVPDVDGMSINDAIDTLTNAGFQVSTDSLPSKLFWDLYSVTGTDPTAGAMRLPGTQITITGFQLG